MNKIDENENWKFVSQQEMLEMLEKAKDELDNKGEDEIQNLLEKVTYAKGVSKIFWWFEKSIFK